MPRMLWNDPRASWSSDGSANRSISPQEAYYDERDFSDIWQFMKKPNSRDSISLTHRQHLSEKEDCVPGRVLYVRDHHGSKIDQKVMLVIADYNTSLTCLSFCIHESSWPRDHWLIEDVHAMPIIGRRPQTLFVSLAPHLKGFVGEVFLQSNIMIDVRSPWSIKKTVDVYDLGRIKTECLYEVVEEHLSRYCDTIRSGLPYKAVNDPAEEQIQQPLQQPLQQPILQEPIAAQDAGANATVAQDQAQQDFIKQKRRQGWVREHKSKGGSKHETNRSSR